MSSVSLINGHIDDDIPRMTPQEAIEFIKNEVEVDVRFCSKEDITKTEVAFELAVSALEKLADLVEVVRCRDCSHAIINEFHEDKPLICCMTKMCGTTKPMWFCADGERRDEK